MKYLMPPVSSKQHLQTFLLVFALSVFSFPSEAQTHTKYIVVDQFGYLPDSRKVAVIRDPIVGFDESESFSPGATYALVNSSSNEHVFSGELLVWNDGETDNSSGDKAWWFDFSAVTTPGTYYVLDIDKNLRSFEFEISSEVYDQVLKHAVRTFFYQRAGFEKNAQYAGAAWADGASHLGPLQDKNARPYDDKNNSAKEIDVSGGWYDAGDYNKYTSWTANYIVEFMRAYIEAPAVWADDYNIPESGNGIPDLLDEAKWGIDHLLRMQKSDGSVLSIVGLSHASPPSSATGPSLYGSASTSATLNTTRAFAIASKVFKSRGMDAYADTLKSRAIKAWRWAEENPSVIFRNNDSAFGSLGLGAGQQETDDYGRLTAKLEAACFLFEVTGEAIYKTYFDSHYQQAHLIEWGYAYPFEASIQTTLLYYTQIPGATPGVVEAIKATYQDSMNKNDNFPFYYDQADPYMAHLQAYTWGSNSTKALQGLMFTDLLTYDIAPDKHEDAVKAAEGFIHYIHGVNPMNLVYLSNMYAYGAENSVNEFYHTWFSNGSPKWDRVGESTYGPAPGFLAGGPNPSYDWDGCCPSGCGGNGNEICSSESITPPKGQPDQKSYKDFNTSWPINSWSVTENSNGYQINYIRLLSKFISSTYDCSGTKNGTATFDICNTCSGGTTGKTPVTKIEECSVITSVELDKDFSVKVFPNPTDGIIKISNEKGSPFHYMVTNTAGVLLQSGTSAQSGDVIDVSSYETGIYILRIQNKEYTKFFKFVKK